MEFPFTSRTVLVPIHVANRFSFHSRREPFQFPFMSRTVSVPIHVANRFSSHSPRKPFQFPFTSRTVSVSIHVANRFSFHSRHESFQFPLTSRTVSVSIHVANSFSFHSRREPFQFPFTSRTLSVSIHVTHRSISAPCNATRHAVPFLPRHAILRPHTTQHIMPNKSHRPCHTAYPRAIVFLTRRAVRVGTPSPMPRHRECSATRSALNSLSSDVKKQNKIWIWRLIVCSWLLP